MKRRAWSLGAALLLLCATQAAQAAQASPSEERARILRQRGELKARFDADEAACRSRFGVTGCINDVKARRRDAMNVLREQELQLNEAERKERSAARLQALEAKRQQAAARPPAPPPPLAVTRPAGGAGSAPVLREPRRPRDDAADAQAAARRAAAAGQRLQDAADDRAKIAAREAERARNPKKSAPLPLPPEVAASGAVRP